MRLNLTVCFLSRLQEVLYIAVVPVVVLDLQVTTQQQIYCKSILPYLTEQPIRDCLDVGWQAKDVGVEVTREPHALGTVAFPIESDDWTQGHKRTRASVSRSMSKGDSVQDGFLGQGSVALEGRLGRFLWVGCCFL